MTEDTNGRHATVELVNAKIDTVNERIRRSVWEMRFYALSQSLLVVGLLYGGGVIPPGVTRTAAAVVAAVFR